MNRPLRPPNESIFAHGMWRHMIWVGLLIAGLSIFSQARAYHGAPQNWRTIVFTVLTFYQLAHALVTRSESDSRLLIGILSNAPLLGAAIITVVLQLCVIYVPFLNPIFKTSPLTGTELAVCFTLPVVAFIAVEMEKWLVRRGVLYQETRSVTCFNPTKSSGK